MAGVIVWILIGSTLGAGQIVLALGLTRGCKILLGGIVPALLAVAATVALEMREGGGGGFRGALVGLGLGAPGAGQVKVGAICLLPIMIAYLAIFAGLQIPSDFVPHLPLVILKFVIAQGIAEEVVFRGFVFRRLRSGRSFLRAATLSAVLFSGFHLANFIHGFSLEMLVGVGISMAFSFFVSFPAAYLFERGGNAIWGFGLLHVGIDSINWFARVSEPGLGLAVYLCALIVSSLLVFRLGILLRPDPDD